MVKIVLLIIVGLTILALSYIMFIIGATSTHLSELKDFWYFPVPVGIICLSIGILGLIKLISKESVK